MTDYSGADGGLVNLPGLTFALVVCLVVLPLAVLIGNLLAFRAGDECTSKR